MRDVLTFVDRLMLLLLGFASILAALLGLFPNWFARIGLPALDYPTLGVGILGVIAVHLVGVHLSRRTHHTTMQQALARLAVSVEGVQIRSFEDGAELDRYIAMRISSAKTEVCDLSWKSSISAQYGLKHRKKATQSYESAIKDASDRISYREVFVFNDARRLDKLKHRLRENRAGYSCAYFPDAHSHSIPRLQFVLVDGEEVIFASSAYPQRCAIMHKALAEIFHYYFEEIWAAATKIKDGDILQKDVVARLVAGESD